jgi:hypothetical protein
MPYVHQPPFPHSRGDSIQTHGTCPPRMILSSSSHPLMTYRSEIRVTDPY